jgi:PilZ domain
VSQLVPGVVVTVEGTRHDGTRTLLRGRVVAADDVEAAVQLEGGLRRLDTGRGDLLGLRWFRVDGSEGISARVVDLSPLSDGLVVLAPVHDGPEQRESARLHTHGEVRWTTAGDGGDGRLLDVGPGGLRFVAAEAPETGSPVALAVLVDGESFDVTGVVVGEAGSARRVRFDRVDEDAAAAIEEALATGVRAALLR